MRDVLHATVLLLALIVIAAFLSRRPSTACRTVSPYRNTLQHDIHRTALCP